MERFLVYIGCVHSVPLLSGNMDALNDLVSAEDLEKFESIYYEELKDNNVTSDSVFHYAWCLVRSKYPADIKKGIILLEQLCKDRKCEVRDCLYFLAIGNARMKKYSQALGYCRKFLEIEPTNSQVQELERMIKNTMDKEGLVGMAITGAFVMVVAAAVGLGVAITKRG